MQVTPQQAIKHIKQCLKAKLVPMITGSPGICKSDIVAQIARQYSLKLIDIRLSQHDPCDLSGFPTILNGRSGYVPMDTFPLEGDSLPEPDENCKNYQGWLIFFDEINSAALATQAASYKIILDKMIGQKHLHKKVALVCAGNMSTDNAIVNRLSTAMQSRLIHLEIKVDLAQWVEWANKNAIDHRVIAYIQSRPDNLMNFNPDHNDKTFSSPRTWEFTSKLIIDLPNLRDDLPLLAGTISEAVAREFILYTDMYSDMPSIDKIIRNPNIVEVSSEPGILYAVSNMIAAYAKSTNIDPLMEYINRLPIEFGTITLQNLLHRNKDMLKEKSILKWIETKSIDLF